MVDNVIEKRRKRKRGLFSAKSNMKSYKEYSKDFRKMSNKLRTSSDGRAYQDGKQEGRETATARTIEG